MIDAKDVTPRLLKEWRDAFDSVDYQSVSKIPVQVFIEGQSFALQQGADKRAEVVEAKGLLLTAILEKYIENTQEKNVNPLIGQMYEVRGKHGIRTRHRNALESLKETIDNPIAKAASASVAVQGVLGADYYNMAGGPAH